MYSSRLTCRVAIADDHALLRGGIASQLAGVGASIVGEYDNADDLVASVPDTRPDLVIMDIQLPPTRTDEGIRAAAVIRRTHPIIGILVLSMFDDVGYARAVMSIDTVRLGYLLKPKVANLEEFVDAIDRILHGGHAIDPEIVRLLVGLGRTTSRLDTLTAREESVLRLMAEGYSNLGIAERLGIAVRTVESNTAATFRKLDLVDEPDSHRRVQAVLAWLRSRS